MSSIGPQLPTELTKRKRSPDQDAAASPPAKQARSNVALPQATNDDEIGLSDSDDNDTMGPSAPSAASIGPICPPRTAQDNTHEIHLSDSASDTNKAPPAPPPKLQSHPQPQPQPQLQDQKPVSSSESDSEDDYGPSLPSSTTPRQTIGPTLPSKEPVPQRDTWMLAPPPSTAYSERDPTRMRARKFASKPLSSSAGKPSPEHPSIWTETPQEKLQRQKDALLGRTPSASHAAAGGAISSSSSSSSSSCFSSERAKMQKKQQEERIAASIEASRGKKSLYAEHDERRREGGGGGNGRGEKEAEEDDDPSKRAFDREKDMAIGGKIGSRARTELISRSANFGGRFQKGSFL
ncbi:hypothetical protein E4U17_002736 [Claviceps sp. LM77 group G4]|nr:hypothetical protein E4U17_002736 [Claviceps sp. LM77 group G4]KAG6064201.1 hypothetical protein E4U33_006207 [Claviceps sp. LM78 group G4]KAG6076763.1 hypothetical protein E4U16_002612 [Claviceps sp. LM84 group G4]